MALCVDTLTKLQLQITAIVCHRISGSMKGKQTLERVGDLPPPPNKDLWVRGHAYIFPKVLNTSGNKILFTTSTTSH
jgi:hypothetical protein